ncbi:MAG: copper-containing nitrite reductase [Acidobacteriota bacterium]
MAFAPAVPPPTGRSNPATVRVNLNSSVAKIPIAPGVLYPAWTFNDRVPGPMIRARVGDTLEVTVTNTDPSGMPHSLDFHAVTGPGGGMPLTSVVPGERKVAAFKLLNPGLYVYHCGTPPVMEHIANGMYGLILVEPKEGLPKVDREFYILQSEFYTSPPTPGSPEVKFSYEDGLREDPRYIVFNGGQGSAMGEGALHAKVGETVRIFFGNPGPNKASSFHMIGAVFDKVYRDADFVTPPARNLQTALVPPGSATVVEIKLSVPGTYTFVDHAIFRVAKGAVGNLVVEGNPNPEISRSVTTTGAGN